MKKWIVIFSGLVLVAFSGFVVANKVSPISWGLWGEYNTSSGLALKGHDPIAYFQTGQPTPGDDAYVFDWSGATWKFANAEHRDLFSQDPQRYAPQFGGFCSFAVSKGFTADISPDAWHIEGDKLYVFADKNVKEDWVATIVEGSLGSSASNWKKRQ